MTKILLVVRMRELQNILRNQKMGEWRMVYMDDEINWLVGGFMVMLSHCGHCVWSSQRHYDEIYDNLKMHSLFNL